MLYQPRTFTSSSEEISRKADRGTRLLAIDNSNVARVAYWLAQPENYRWLDFGRGSEPLSATAVRVLSQRPSHVVRIFADERHVPIGLVALSNVNRDFLTALLWYVLGEKRYAGNGYTSRAVGALLRIAFDDMRLAAVHAWVVAQNHASIRVLERNGFRQTGRQRQCHVIDGKRCDRLLYDMIAAEYRSRRHPASRACGRAPHSGPV